MIRFVLNNISQNIKENAICHNIIIIMYDFIKILKEVNEGKSYLFFLGQAGFIIKTFTGKTIAIDLYLSDCGERKYGFKRLMPKLLNPDEISFDCLIATHAHYDHFDVDAIPSLLSNGQTKLICALDCKNELLNLDISPSQITYMVKGDHLKIIGIDIKAVFCDHGLDTPYAIGLVIDFDGKRLYFAGDTSLRLDKAQELAEFGPFDIMIAPINGAFGNMNESEAVTLCSALKPKLIIPCHYWNWAEHGGNPGLFVRILEERLPNQKYLLMRMGEGVEI